MDNNFQVKKNSITLITFFPIWTNFIIAPIGHNIVKSRLFYTNYAKIVN